MFYIYILYSESADKYYIGQSDDPERRLNEHNTADKNNYTFRYRPWVLKASFPVSESRGEAMMVEKHIKMLKSRRSIKGLILKPERFAKIIERVRAVPTFRGREKIETDSKAGPKCRDYLGSKK